MPFGVTTYQDREAGQYSGAVGLLQAENNSLRQNFETSVKMDTLGINSFRYDLYKQPVEIIDQKIQSVYLNPIKDKKNNIISLGGLAEAENNMEYFGSSSAAISALETLYGAPSENDGVISTRQTITSLVWTGAGNTAGINVSAGAAISTGGAEGGGGVALFDVSAAIGQAARVDVQDVTGNVSAGTTFYVNGTAQSGGATSREFAASGEVYEEVVIVTYYPSLHPPDAGAANPLFNPQFKILPVNGTDGLGSGQTYYRNSIQGSYGSFPDCNDSSFPVLLNDVYTVTTNATAIANDRADIDALRGTDITTGIQSYVGAGSTLKNTRQEFAINQWSLVKNGQQTQAKINANDAAIAILKNSAFQP